MILQKIKNAFIKLTIKWRQYCRRRQLHHTDFTIISNNCWAGTAVYQSFGLKYNTPTVGLFIMDEDYMKFLERLDRYMAQVPVIIRPEQSKYYSKISANGTKPITYPIATIGGDVEIHFLHYPDAEEAIEKWMNRKQRINYDRLLVKMSLRDSGYDVAAMLNRFHKLPYKNKICFSPIGNDSSDVVVVPELKKLNLVGGDETEYTLRHINIVKVLNSVE